MISVSPIVVRVVGSVILFYLGTYVRALPYDEFDPRIALAMVVVTLLSGFSSFVLIWRKYGKHLKLDQYPSWSSPVFKNRLPLQDEFEGALSAIIVGCGGMIGAYVNKSAFSGGATAGIAWGVGILLSIKIYLSWVANPR